MITQSLINKKHALIAICMCFGFAASILAGPRDTQVSNAETAPKAIEDEEQPPAAAPTLEDEVTFEDRVRLRRALDAFAKSADPSHAQLEQRRREMRKRVHVRFSGADKDNDGTLSRDESTEALPQIARHFDEIDFNGDDIITMKELESAEARVHDRRRAEETKIDEIRLNEIKEAELLLKRKNKQATAARKRAL